MYDRDGHVVDVSTDKAVTEHMVIAQGYLAVSRYRAEQPTYDRLAEIWAYWQ